MNSVTSNISALNMNESGEQPYHNGMSEGELIAITAVYGIVLVAILVGNGLIIASIFINKRLRTATNRLVIGLSVSDTLVGLVSIPCWMYIYVCLYYHAPVSEVLLQFYAASDIFIGSACILQLTSISLERCHAVARPFQHRTLPRRVFYSMLFIPWLYAGFVAALHPLQFGIWTEVYTVLMTTTCFLLPLLIIIITYSFIVQSVRSKTRHKLSEQQSRHRSTSYRREIRLAITVALITIIFVIEWLPLFVVTVVATYYPTHLPSPLWTDRLLKFVKWMHYSNSAVDPFIYAYRNPDIISTFRYVVWRLLCRHERASESRRRLFGNCQSSLGIYQSCSSRSSSQRSRSGCSRARGSTVLSRCEFGCSTSVRRSSGDGDAYGMRGPNESCSAI